MIEFDWYKFGVCLLIISPLLVYLVVEVLENVKCNNS
jgi:hypothetical protein